METGVAWKVGCQYFAASFQDLVARYARKRTMSAELMKYYHLVAILVISSEVWCKRWHFVSFCNGTENALQNGTGRISVADLQEVLFL